MYILPVNIAPDKDVTLESEARPSMLILSRDDLRQALPMDQTMGAVAEAFAQISNREADVPLRLTSPFLLRRVSRS